MSIASPQWEAYANWLLMDDASRARLNLPKNKAEYAIANKIADRTIRRWQNDPLFIALLEKKQGSKGKRGIAAVSLDGTPAILDDGDHDGGESTDTPEDEYQQIKSALVKGALTGDPKYLDLYFKSYGKEFVAEEVAARTSDLAGLSLDALILEAASVLGEPRIVDYLRSKGYEVTPPPGEGNADPAAEEGAEDVSS